MLIQPSVIKMQWYKNYKVINFKGKPKPLKSSLCIKHQTKFYSRVYKTQVHLYSKVEQKERNMER